jgi:hypothetical protein
MHPQQLQQRRRLLRRALRQHDTGASRFSRSDLRRLVLLPTRRGRMHGRRRLPGGRPLPLRNDPTGPANHGAHLRLTFRPSIPIPAVNAVTPTTPSHQPQNLPASPPSC